MTPQFYIYQTIHVYRGIPRLLDAHVRTLNTTAYNLYGRPYTPDLRSLAARIVDTVSSTGVSEFVQLGVLSDGQEQLTPAGASLYEGYALRSIFPDAVAVAYDLPSDAQTSAWQAATELARFCAKRAGAASAVQFDRNGSLPTADGAPLFGIRAKEIFTAAPESVERDLALKAAHAAGFSHSAEPLCREMLPRLDELFYADHRGITALAHCDGYPYLSLAAERIAAGMEALFIKK